jgi:hypothetical protein
MATKILITGGTGLIGTALSKLLTKHRYVVSHLSRTRNASALYPTFTWDVNKRWIEASALQTDYIIHLAGAGIADHRWTDKRKQILADSRIKSADLLYDHVKKLKIKPKGIISASAIGFYGAETGDKTMVETSPPGRDFLGKLVQNWEEKIQVFEALGISVTILRIGIGLAGGGGALRKLALPIKLGIGALFASGKQNMSWIHIDDLCELIAFSIKSQLRGVYNAVSNCDTNQALTFALAKQLNRKVILPNIPVWALKILLGEMAEMVIGGNKVNADKIRNEGFMFKYTKLEDALDDIY